jgi:hypothetical protein
VRLCLLLGGITIVLVGLSRNLVLTGMLLALTGASYMLFVALLNVGVQLSVPRWVTARALAWFQSSLTGGLAFGAWLWGTAAAHWGVSEALCVSGMSVLLSPLIGLVLPMRGVLLSAVEMVELGRHPEVALALTARSGPIVIEVDYHVDPDRARQFYGVMLKLQLARQRNGAFDWSLSRDIADPALWTERYHCPTWGDYLHMRSRFTSADRELQLLADTYHTALPGMRVRRRLERPFGSVRSSADTPDLQRDTIGLYTP